MAETRVVHCKREPHDVYIGRPGFWGNPYSDDPYAAGGTYLVGSREEAIRLYEEWIRLRLASGERFLSEKLVALYGLTLGCWCAPSPCHGDVLARLAEELVQACQNVPSADGAKLQDDAYGVSSVPVAERSQDSSVPLSTDVSPLSTQSDMTRFLQQKYGSAYKPPMPRSR